jgi:hypothetical protein
MNTPTHSLVKLLSLSVLTGAILIGCRAINKVDSFLTPIAFTEENACKVTEPVWAKPPQDSAVQDPSAYGYYYMNQDRTIWASAWWPVEDENYLRATQEGVKMGWFRPAGAELKITGQRLDSMAPPLETHVPCCYPTRFQATGLYFPMEGCWEITARAADSVLSFTVWVDP